MKNCQIVVLCKECGEVHKKMKEGDKEPGGKQKCTVCASDMELPKVLVLAPQTSTPAPEEE